MHTDVRNTFSEAISQTKQMPAFDAEIPISMKKQRAAPLVEELQRAYCAFSSTASTNWIRWTWNSSRNPMNLRGTWR